MNVYVVTVTYGNRHEFVKKLVERVIAIGVTSVILVDNNSTEESKAHLKLLTEAHASKIELITLSKNYGSADGFKKGLVFAESQLDCDFIWLLDDDNLPESTALQELLKSYQLINANCCLVSLRKSRVPYQKIFNERDVQRKFHPYNSYLNYNLVHGFRKKFLYSFKKKKLDLISIPYGPYGGMFFHKKMLSVIGYPNEKMFVYMDDHEFSHRIIKANLKIYLNRKSVVEDMEPSWHDVKKYRVFNRFMQMINGDETKTYYLLRNLIFFEKKYYVNNNVAYSINKFLYKSIYYTLCLILNKRDRIALLERAIIDSEKLNSSMTLR